MVEGDIHPQHDSSFVEAVESGQPEDVKIINVSPYSPFYIVNEINGSRNTDYTKTIAPVDNAEYRISEITNETIIPVPWISPKQSCSYVFPDEQIIVRRQYKQRIKNKKIPKKRLKSRGPLSFID